MSIPRRWPAASTRAGHGDRAGGRAVHLSAGLPAADGRDRLAQAIANTRGSYLVYNFGNGFPAPMLNAAGNWYEMNNGGHLMIAKGLHSACRHDYWSTLIVATRRAASRPRERAPRRV